MGENTKHIYEVKIEQETETSYIIKYIKLLKGAGLRVVRPLVVKKERLYDVYDKKIKKQNPIEERKKISFLSKLFNKK